VLGVPVPVGVGEGEIAGVADGVTLGVGVPVALAGILFTRRDVLAYFQQDR